MPTTALSPQVDAYLSKVPAFALPILEHLRQLVHRGCPGVEETIKWSRPFFTYRGAILCNMSAFQKHCSFGFWGQEIGEVLTHAKIVSAEGMGTLGRITSLSSLPADKHMLLWIRQAAAFIDRGEYSSSVTARRVVKTRLAIEAPPEWERMLKQNKPAADAFARMSPSCRREYVEWIATAKRPETRDKRIAAAIETITAGKQLHWKYQNS